MRNLAAACAIAGLSALLPMEAASAREYGSQHLGFSRALTWVFLDSPGQVRHGDLIGYACVTSDALFGMPRTADASRYAIRWGEGQAELEPLNGIVVMNDGGPIRARETTPESAQYLWDATEVNPGDGWFMANMDTDPMGRTCVDGGIAAVVESLERNHGIRISR